MKNITYSAPHRNSTIVSLTLTSRRQIRAFVPLLQSCDEHNQKSFSLFLRMMGSRIWRAIEKNFDLARVSSFGGRENVALFRKGRRLENAFHQLSNLSLKGLQSNPSDNTHSCQFWSIFKLEGLRPLRPIPLDNTHLTHVRPHQLPNSKVTMFGPVLYTTLILLISPCQLSNEGLRALRPNPLDNTLRKFSSTLN